MGNAIKSQLWSNNRILLLIPCGAERRPKVLAKKLGLLACAHAHSPGLHTVSHASIKAWPLYGFFGKGS